MVVDGVWHCAIPHYCLVNQTSRWGNKSENPGYYGYRVLALQLISLKIDFDCDKFNSSSVNINTSSTNII